ncbi:PilZ domain-containing protein [Rhizobium sp. MHM7A]|uniref:PilZ domain-containing protein n=1 Tax=Rhizobium sp. MHM7A TaxID=2583233 RepID=UPI001106B043|nr:PilZ domain-containing protein [Rhizobium sp. MHM7A]TLX15954.1 PilZ domain-containing protein [Rhizobium sp. MHM7A]
MPRRKIHRRKSFKTVRYIQSVGGAGIECTMVDMHSEGARLKFKGPAPETASDVEIMILPELIPVRATLAWKDKNEMGITFRRPLEYLRKSDHPAVPRAVSG